jgi:hypothetical protein
MNRLKNAFALAAIVVSMLRIVSAQAANIELTIDYAGSYDSTLTPLPGSPPAPLFSQNAPHPGAPFAIHVPGASHRFDVYMAITGAAAGEDFQSVRFDFQLGPGVTPADLGYVGEFPLVDPPGPIGNAPVYSQNGDAGPAIIDLKFITVIANSASNHARTHAAHPGEADGTLGFPTKLGSAYVRWDGTFGPDNKSWVAVTATENYPDPWSTVIGDTGQPQNVASMSFGPREEWTTSGPPPFTVNDLVIPGGAPGVLITGGPLPTDDNDDPDNGIAWLLDSLTGPNGPVIGATVHPTTGVFNWQTQPTTARGFYTAVIRGTNDDTPVGSDTGTLSFEIIIPEPATLPLLALAILNMLGFVRGRLNGSEITRE